MVHRFLFTTFVTSFLLLPKLQLCMEQKSHNNCLADGYVDPYSIVLRWPEEQKDLFFRALTKAEESKSMIQYPESDPIGAFDGANRKVVTFFNKGYVKVISFKKFRDLFFVRLQRAYFGCHKIVLCNASALQDDASVKDDDEKGKKQKFKKTKRFLTRQVARLRKK